jgi:hypothetical protein
VAIVGDTGIVYRILVGKLLGKVHLEHPEDGRITLR